MNNKRYAFLLGFLMLLIATIEIGTASYNPLFPVYFTITSNPTGADVYLVKGGLGDCCGGPPSKVWGDFIGKTPLTYKYEYNETFLPFSGLFFLLFFNLTDHESAFKCINIAGNYEIWLSVSSQGYLEPASRTPFIYNISYGKYLEPASETPLTYNISVELRPIEKIDKIVPAFEVISGFVFDSEGKTISGAAVSLERYDEKGLPRTDFEEQITYDKEGNPTIHIVPITATSHWLLFHETYTEDDGFYSFNGLNLSSEDIYRISVQYGGNSTSSANFTGTKEKMKYNINISLGEPKIPEEGKKAPTFEVVSLIGVLLLTYLFRRKRS